METGDASPFLQCSYILANLMVHVRYPNDPWLGLWQILLFMQSPTVGVKVCIGIQVTNVYIQEQGYGTTEWKCHAKPQISVSFWSSVWTLTPSEFTLTSECWLVFTHRNRDHPAKPQHCVWTMESVELVSHCLMSGDPGLKVKQYCYLTELIVFN